MDFERTTTVGAPADAAFELLADPSRLAEWVPPIEHVETLVEEGDAPAGEARLPRFLVDETARRIEWGEPDVAYGGSAEVRAGTSSTSDVTIRLRTRDDVDREKVEQLLGQAARNVGRLAARR